jgi:hypothetical protein
MERAAIDRIERKLRSVFPDDAIERVEVLEHSDDLAVEPGLTALRVFIDRGGRPEGEEADLEIVHRFDEAHNVALRKLHDELPPVIAWVEFVPGGPAARPHGPRLRTGLERRAAALEEVPGDLTPVMTRLGPADLATVDTLITAGIATSRAEVLRWAVGRIREHPAYAQLQQRVQEIDELKAQF